MNKNILSNIILFVMVSLLSYSLNAKDEKYTQKGSTITSNNVRLQFLTPTLLRLEYSPSNKFAEEPSVIVLKRDWGKDKVKVQAEEKEGWLYVKSEKMEVKYKIGTGKYSSENLKILWISKNAEHSWKPGDIDNENLKAITYSLDGIKKGKLPKFSDGILSRNGYFFLDDSKTPLWDKKSSWIVKRDEKDYYDWYFFVYNGDYQHVLNEYAELCGKIPLIPKYTLGAWITDLNFEYFPGSDYAQKNKYSDEDLKKIVIRFRNEKIPLDIFVLDFAWHNYGWKGGYDWSPIFPKPAEFLKWAKQNGIKLSSNDHPGYGKENVLSDEDSRSEKASTALNLPKPVKAKYMFDLSQEWKLRTDTTDVGTKQEWYSKNYNDQEWKITEAGRAWEDQGFPDYDGIGWFRKWITIPEVKDYDKLMLLFSGVDDEYDLFIDGEKITHFGGANMSVWNSPTYINVNKYMKPGQKYLIALRVNDWGGGGGLTGKIYLTDKLPSDGIKFNLAVKKEAQVYMDILHNPLIDEGINFWWVDGGTGAAEFEGLNPQLWTNYIYYDLTENHTNKRGFVFSRYGGYGSHRYPAIFTGDTYAHWEVLGHEVIYSALGGNTLMPYITHDIGGFIGSSVPFDLWARWIQFGVFNPFLRLHSAHENPVEGNLRMPWTYGKAGIDLARKYFNLRYKLIPYIYTYCRTAYDKSLPLNRPLYYEYPELDESYSNPYEYFFGSQFLVTPIIDSSGEKDIYLPPGDWYDYFSNKKFSGNRKIHTAYDVETMPLFVKAGSIIPMQPEMNYVDEKPMDKLIVNFYGIGGEFNLYEDDGISLDYKKGKFATTLFTSSVDNNGNKKIVINPSKGNYKGLVSQRSYDLVIYDINEPKDIKVNGIKINERTESGTDYSYKKENTMLIIHLKPVNIKEGQTITIINNQ